MGLLIFLSLFIEVGVLLYLELKAWDTLFTPLNILMLPYLVVLLISVGISGHMGFVDMYYPSILIWSVSLLIFAVPSQYLGYILHKNGKPYQNVVENDEMPSFLIWLSLLVCMGLVFRLRQTIGSCPFQIGSNEFGEAFDHYGLWSHVSRLNTIMLMIMVFYVDKNHKYIWLIILFQLILLFIHKVKGWIFVPIIAGMIMRLYSGKSRLSLGFFVFTILSLIPCTLSSSSSMPSPSQVMFSSPGNCNPCAAGPFVLQIIRRPQWEIRTFASPMNDKELRPGQRAKFPWAGSKFGVTWTEIVNFNNGSSQE